MSGMTIPHSLLKLFFPLLQRRRLNSANSQRDIVRKSYEFALNHIGQDKDSGPIWHDYIQLIKSGEVSKFAFFHAHLLNDP